MKLFTKKPVINETEEREAVEREAAEREAAEREAAQKSFNSIIPLCLSCRNAIQYRYVPNPKNSTRDPLIVICKIKQIREMSNEFWRNNNAGPECWMNEWNKKCISCSEYTLINNE